MRGDVRLDAPGVRVHHLHSLRQFLQALEAPGAPGIAPQRFADGLGEFRRLRGFHADERNAFVPVLEPDLDAVGRVRIDHDAIVLPHPAYRCDPVRVRARARYETGLRNLPEIYRARKVDCPLALELVPKTLQNAGVTPHEVVGVALEIR